MFASAQFYVGGSLGMDYSKNKSKFLNETTDGAKTFAWDITPSVGFMFAENMGVGIDLGFGMSTTTHPKTETTPEIKNQETKWIVAPYFRYVFMGIENFKFYGDVKLNFNGGKEKVKSDGDTHDGDKVFNWGIGIYPGMAYMLTENISMNCSLNILALSFGQTKVTSKVGDDDKVDTNTAFGFGINRATPITIGFFYTF